MELVEVDERYRVTIPKDVRTAFKVVKGQQFYLVPYGNDLLMRPVPADPAKKLDSVIGDFRFDRESRRKAQEWLLKQQRDSR
jgi:bifunctional DNA-binding transcriptional regulator/antitoxin component of YhaV-PrlF toxin-antitoxin module